MRTWTRTRQDNCRILTNPPYEIVELYEPGLDGDRWQLNKDDRFVASLPSMRAAKALAEEDWRFS